MRVVLTTEALERVAEIEARVADKNPAAAAKLATKILARARTLEAFPRMGPSALPENVDAAGDLLAQYEAMLELGWAEADKYFHCMGHCLACSRGPGGQVTSAVLGYGREAAD